MTTTAPVLDESTRREGFALDPAPKRSRTPEVALGLLLIVLASLGALWLFGVATERSEALALASDVAAGEVLTRDDLMVVEITTNDDLAVLSRTDLDTVVGEMAVADWPAGALVTPSMFVTDDVLTPGSATIGIEVSAGAMPVTGLGRGDDVILVETPATSSLEEPSEDAKAGPVLANAVVLEVVSVGTDGAQRVSVVLSAEAARAVAVADAQERVRLVKVEPS